MVLITLFSPHPIPFSLSLFSLSLLEASKGCFVDFYSVQTAMGFFSDDRYWKPARRGGTREREREIPLTFCYSPPNSAYKKNIAKNGDCLNTLLLQTPSHLPFIFPSFYPLLKALVFLSELKGGSSPFSVGGPSLIQPSFQPKKVEIATTVGNTTEATTLLQQFIKKKIYDI